MKIIQSWRYDSTENTRETQISIQLAHVFSIPLPEGTVRAIARLTLPVALGRMLSHGIIYSDAIVNIIHVNDISS